MDINDLRSFFTVFTLLVFVGIVWWAYSSHRKQAFDEAAMLPFEEDESPKQQWPANKASHAD